MNLKLKQFLKRNRLFWRFLSSYLLIMVVVLLTGSVAQYKATRTLEAELRDKNQTLLQQGVSQVDKELHEMEKLSIRLSLNTQLIRSLDYTKPLKPEQYYEMKSVIDEIMQYTITDAFIQSFFIYSRKGDVIITRETLYDPSVFRARAMNFELLDEATWKTRFLFNNYQGTFLPVHAVKINETPYRVIPYIRSLPLGPLESPRANLVILIDESAFQNLMAPLANPKGGWAYIAGADGQILTQINHSSSPLEALTLSDSKDSDTFRQIIRGEEMEITYMRSPLNKWVYVSAVPARVLLDKVSGIRSFMLVFALVALGLGLMISAYATFRNARPLTQVMRLIENSPLGGDKEPPRGRENMLQDLQSRVSSILKNSEALQAAVSQQQPIIRQAFYERLFKGELSGETEIRAMMDYLGIQMEARQYMVVLMHVFDDDAVLTPDIIAEFGLAKIMLKEAIFSILGDKGLIYDADERRMAMILYFYTDDTQVCRQNAEAILMAIRRQVQEEHLLTVRFTAGGLCREVTEIGRSFDEARAAHGKAVAAEPVVWFDAGNRQQRTFYYPLELETRLYNCLKAGERDEAERIFQMVYHENTENRALSPNVLKLLMYQIRGTVLRVVAGLEMPDDGRFSDWMIQPLVSFEFSQAFRQGQDIALSLCDQIAESRRNRSAAMGERLMAFISAHYANPDLSLTLVAGEFGLTEGYVSHFFKDATGDNFLSYLEGVRMQHACSQLRLSERSVADIALSVGYNSDQAFRRAFKRVLGVSPVAWREQNSGTST